MMEDEWFSAASSIVTQQDGGGGQCVATRSQGEGLVTPSIL